MNLHNYTVAVLMVMSLFFVFGGVNFQSKAIGVIGLALAIAEAVIMFGDK